MLLLDCLVYLSYACAAITLLLYLLILWSLRFVKYGRTLIFSLFYILLRRGGWGQHILFRRQRLKLRKSGKHASMPKAQLQLLKQSLIVFALYAVMKMLAIVCNLSQASILCVFAMSFVRPKSNSDAFPIAYIENLLNLSIAAVYPICFLATSGEMRRHFL